MQIPCVLIIIKRPFLKLFETDHHFLLEVQIKSFNYLFNRLQTAPTQPRYSLRVVNLALNYLRFLAIEKN